MGTSISLGNLKVRELEQRMGWIFSEEDKVFLEQHRVDEADFQDKTKLHIFDIPFELYVGEDIHDEVVKLLTKYNNEKLGKARLQVTKMIPKPKPLTVKEKREKVFELYMKELEVINTKRKSQKALQDLELIIDKLIKARPCMTLTELGYLKTFLETCKYASEFNFDICKNNRLYAVRKGYNSYYINQEYFMKRWYWEKPLVSGDVLKGWVSTIAEFKDGFDKTLTGTIEITRKDTQYYSNAKINEAPDADIVMLEYNHLYKLNDNETITFSLNKHLIEPWIYEASYPLNGEEEHLNRELRSLEST